VRGADASDLLVVGYVYYPVLVHPLLTTLTTLVMPQYTTAMVVVELHTEDVLREFLQGWIALGRRVWCFSEDLLGARCGMWVACCKT
jgi:hypothetical protein